MYHPHRRFPRHLTHGDLTSWSAEEMLIWIRLEWRHIFNVAQSMQMDEHEDALLSQVHKAWVLLEDFVLSVLDRRGLQCTTAELGEKAVVYIHHLKTAQVHWPQGKGRAYEDVFVVSHAYITITVHMLLHLGTFTQAWGNLWETWCFVFERMAGVYTHICVGWNFSNALGDHLNRRMTIRAASAMLLSNGRECSTDGNGNLVEPGQLWSDTVLVPVLPKQSKVSLPPVGVVAETTDGHRAKYERFNKIKLGGVRLGFRNFKDMQSSPWRLDMQSSKKAPSVVLVRLQTGKLHPMIVDGAARVHTKDNTEQDGRLLFLVGIVLEALPEPYAKGVTVYVPDGPR